MEITTTINGTKSIRNFGGKKKSAKKKECEINKEICDKTIVFLNAIKPGKRDLYARKVAAVIDIYLSPESIKEKPKITGCQRHRAAATQIKGYADLLKVYTKNKTLKSLHQIVINAHETKR